MLATLTLQLNSIELSAEAPNATVSSRFAASQSHGESHTDFAELLRSRVDTSLLSTTPEGEFLPSTGNTLPSASAQQFDATSIQEDASGENLAVLLPAIELAADSPLAAGTDIEIELTHPLTETAVARHGPIAEIAALLHAPTNALDGTTAIDTSDTGPSSRAPVPLSATLQSQLALSTVELSVKAGDYNPAAALVVAPEELSGVKLPPRPDVAVLARDQSTPTSDPLKPLLVASAHHTDVVSNKAADRLRLPISEIRQFTGSSSQPGAALVTSVATTPAMTAPSFAADLELASATINTPVRDTAWGERIGERVLMLAGSQLKMAEIRLTPAELGPLRIQVVIEDSTANVSFQSQHAVTRDAIEQALPRLRELLAENGLTLGQSSVSEQDLGNGDREQSATPNRQPRVIANDAGSSTADNTVAASALRAANGLIDTFV